MTDGEWHCAPSRKREWPGCRINADHADVPIAIPIAVVDATPISAPSTRRSVQRNYKPLCNDDFASQDGPAHGPQGREASHQTAG